MTAPPPRSLDARLARAIFVTTFAVYLLSSGREPPWGDANVQYMVAESLVRRAAIDIPKPWPDDLPRGRGGTFYSTYPIFTSLVQVPGLALLEGATALSKDARGLAKPLTSHLACSAFGALACVLFFQLCRQRRLSRRAASAATAILAFATTTWVYAHYSYSEIAQAAFFTGFVLHLLRVDEDPTPARARWLGLHAGLLFSTKYIYAAAILGGAALLAWRLRRDRRLLGRLARNAAATSAPFAAAALIYNFLCWGSPISTGYHPYFETYWGEHPLVGLWGMFLSPGKSVFLYSPPLLLGLAALPRLWRDHRPACLAVLAAAAPVLAVYSRYKLNGDYAWGPRFAVFFVPALALGFAVLLDAWLAAPVRWLRRAVLALVVALGVAVQLLGNAFYWDHFIRISMDARTAWLGAPNRAGAIIPVRADGRCDSCFEDVHQLEWLPPFQPILGHLWLLRATLRGDDAKQAEADAPWKRHTSLALPIASSYARVRLDWWGLLWISDVPGTLIPGAALLLLFLAAALAGARAWLRAHRAARAGPEDAPAPALAPAAS
ncbi:MAG TPA: hypothetical protein VN253_29940 [Kofleriaceae bacterium]|nr:hypothetical protein [Kofleriaceae bacterium]